ncbi:alpha/beta-hydrolase [Rhizodiscina lignyota]|uniref:Alpha/beta-hydrolase n=1 Tax=Rhizodiscina lignyota TaxID=1504668 RepID=A0A9P4IFU8_9PEZI|nr:alpha/beta-hydrolase [Rhizodiscina lignyota]
MIYDFNKLAPSTEVKWTHCFDNFTCTRLQVPLDYDNPSVGNTSIAFIKIDAVQQPAEDVLVNFGGPGDSGVNSLLDAPESLRLWYGDKVNIVAFDPRGVNYSGPAIDCFPNAPAIRNNFITMYQNLVSDYSSTSVSEQYYWGKALSEWCAKSVGGPNGMARYINTPSVAHDMLTFAEAQAVSNGKSKENATVWYYGYSYGTLLGMTFASLFPERVGRVVLDGVGNMDSYYSGRWDTELVQTDQAVESFFKYCFEAGEESCPFYENSPEAISTRFRLLIGYLRGHPVPVIDDPNVEEPWIATYADFENVLLNALYSPERMFPLLAQILVDLEHRNGTSLLIAAGLIQGSNPATVPALDPSTPGVIISCVDSHGRANTTDSLESFQQYTELLHAQSRYAGGAWSIVVASCQNMDVAPPPSGTFPASLGVQNKTAFPMLFITNSIDPVTPMANARAMASKFPGSVLLEQDSVGHTSSTGVSNCTLGHVYDYWKGKLPSPGTVCQPNALPFQGTGA